MKDQIQFADISKVSIQDFNKEMDQLKNAQLVVIHVHLNSTLAAGRPKQGRTCENCEKMYIAQCRQVWRNDEVEHRIAEVNEVIKQIKDVSENQGELTLAHELAAYPATKMHKK